MRQIISSLKRCEEIVSEEMSFTDDDLKRLKVDHAEHLIKPLYVECKICALIARLEDSEARLRNVEAELKKLRPRLEAAEAVIDGYLLNVNLSIFNDRMQAWRKSKGDFCE